MFSGISGTGRVPGGVFTDLLSNSVLNEDPLRRYNDIAYRWVSEDDWTYSVTFKGEEVTRALMICTGLTICICSYIYTQQMILTIFSINIRL